MTLESYLNFSVFVKWTIKYRVEDLNLIMDIRYLTHYKLSHGTLYLMSVIALCYIEVCSVFAYQTASTMMAGKLS